MKLRKTIQFLVLYAKVLKLTLHTLSSLIERLHFSDCALAIDAQFHILSPDNKAVFVIPADYLQREEKYGLFQLQKWETFC